VRHRGADQDHGLDKALDHKFLEACRPAIEDGTRVSAEVAVRNVDRTVGTLLGYEITRRHGGSGLPEGTIDLTFRGSAGQSFGAFLSPGVLALLNEKFNLMAIKTAEEDLAEMLAQASHEHNLDVDLLASLVKAESGGNARAVSRAGARGLMQLMPGTANELGVADSFKPDQNVRGGSTYLDALLTRYHDNMALALAAYNAGPEAVDRYNGIPPYRETRAYVARVIHEFNRRVLAREAQTRQASASQKEPSR